MVGCPVFDPTGPFLRAATEAVDCRALAIGEEGYRALSGAGSPLGLAITSLLTIFVALEGYRMVLGAVPSLRASVVTVVKLGFVLALATQWQAYRVVAYEVVVRGPASLVSQLIEPTGVSAGATAGLVDQVETIHQTLDAAARYKPAARGAAPSPPAASNAAAPAPAATAPPRFANVAARTAQILLLATSVAGLLSARLVAGVLLGLGPVFIAAALFEPSRGLFVGWVRGLAGALLAAVGSPLVLALEVALIGPQAAVLLRLRDTPDVMPTLPSQVLATAIIFAIVMSAVLLALAWTASSLRWPRAVTFASPRPPEPTPAAMSPPAPTSAPATAPENPRARAVVQAAAAIDRRERHIVESRHSAVRSQVVDSRTSSASIDPAAATAAGRGGRQDRQTLSASRRDARL